ALDSQTPAGYTYLGQFIGHDITFDPASSLQHDNDPDALVDYRTPRFDLDCLYGRGPADQPYLFEEENRRFILGGPLDSGDDWDVPRVDSTERAIIADPRNDENVILVQLHAIFLRFHNQLARTSGADFATVQRLVRWHYQWIVLYDFLPQIIHEDTYHEVLPHVKKRSNVVADPPKLQFYKVRENAYM